MVRRRSSLCNGGIITRVIATTTITIITIITTTITPERRAGLPSP
jgi:hypothetical protein